MMFWLKMLFARSRYGFDCDLEKCTFVRSKIFGNTMYVLERGEFYVWEWWHWKLLRNLWFTKRPWK